MIEVLHKKQRFIWIDLMKGIAMLMIILSHQTSVPYVYNQLYTPIFLSAFFFVAGYTFNPREGFKSFFFHKLRTIGIPFLSLGVINMVLAMVADGDAFIDRISYLLSIRGYNDDLWFVASLLTSEILFYLFLYAFKRATKKEEVNVLLPLLAFVFAIAFVWYVRTVDVPLPFQLEAAFINLWIIATGYCVRHNTKLSKISTEKHLPIWIIESVVYIVICLSYKNVVNIHRSFYVNYPIYVVAAIVGIPAFLQLTKILERFNNAIIIKCIVFIGQNTLVYYAFQSKAIRLCDLILSRLGLHLNIYIGCVILTIICAVLLAVPAYIIQRYFPFILGKKH